MGLRVRKTISANTKDEIIQKAKQYEKLGWNIGRYLHNISYVTPYRCYIWRDLDDDHRQQASKRYQQQSTS